MTKWSPSQDQGRQCPFPQVYCLNPQRTGYPKGTVASVLGCAQYWIQGAWEPFSKVTANLGWGQLLLWSQLHEAGSTFSYSLILFPSPFTFSSSARPVSSTSEINLNSLHLCLHCQYVHQAPITSLYYKTTQLVSFTHTCPLHHIPH